MNQSVRLNSVGIIIGMAFLALGCSSRSDAQQSVVLTGRGLDRIPLCSPLELVRTIYPDARDTTLSNDGDTWPAKLVRAVDGGELAFESSWADRQRIWLIAVTSGTVRTADGHRVGDKLGQLATSESLFVRAPEGRLMIKLVSDSVSLTLDSSSEAQFHARGDSPNTIPTRELLATGVIRSLFVTADCRRD